MMKLKNRQREFNKLRQQERKEFQERQLQAMENDLKLWQEELKSYQDMSSERASHIVEKKNAITSLKTQEKRLQKEMEHAVMKSKVEEEKRNRQQELKMLVNIKDARSKMIINAKAEYANSGRDIAQVTRRIRNRVQEKKKTSSFDKLSSCGERTAWLERADNSAKRDSTNVRPRNQSAIHLG
jgi:DNA repair exonuclease SbcCD ATPase subunit